MGPRRLVILSGGVPNLDLFLQGHSGSPYRVDRGHRAPLYMQSPALTIGLSPQPDVLRGLADGPGFRSRGLVARFLFALPPSRLGFRSLKAQPIPYSVEIAYSRSMQALLDVSAGRDDEGAEVPYVLRLNSEAFAEWQEFAALVEIGLRPGGKFEYATDWAGKLPGAALRLSGLLHCALHAGGQPWAAEIALSTMTNTLEIMGVLVEHALAVFDLMGADPDLEAARHILRWVERRQLRSFKARTCFNDLKGRFKRMEALEPGFSVLMERHYIRPAEAATERQRGRPSLVFDVNPALSRGWHELA